MNTSELILYVEDQSRSRAFYSTVLGLSPTLDVPGMTEFDLGGATLGLMPAVDMIELLPELASGSGQRCELYLRRPDADEILGRVEAAGGRLLSPSTLRTWGETVGYGLDPDGHVLAIASVKS